MKTRKHTRDGGIEHEEVARAIALYMERGGLIRRLAPEPDWPRCSVGGIGSGFEAPSAWNVVIGLISLEEFQ